MTEHISIGRRFCGPPESANGGYMCGLVADRVNGPAEVTLRRPPPLETRLTVAHQDDGSVLVFDGDALVAEGSPSPGDLGLEVPAPPSVEEARAAGETSRFLRHPEEHPFPTCFACGPDRERGDGLRILVAPVPGRDLSADVWEPDPALAGSDGKLGPEVVWAALDCSSGIGAGGDAAPDGPPFVLGRLSVRQLGPTVPLESHVVIGWRVGGEGRKLFAGSALFKADGELVALARATWIRLA
jgi:hypothetical protein